LFGERKRGGGDKQNLEIVKPREANLLECERGVKEGDKCQLSSHFEFEERLRASSATFRKLPGEIGVGSVVGLSGLCIGGVRK